MDEKVYAQKSFRCASVGGGDMIVKRGEEVDMGKIRLHPKSKSMLKRMAATGYFGSTPPKGTEASPAPAVSDGPSRDRISADDLKAKIDAQK